MRVLLLSCGATAQVARWRGGAWRNKLYMCIFIQIHTEGRESISRLNAKASPRKTYHSLASLSLPSIL